MRLNEPGVHALTDCDQCNRGVLPGPWPPKPCPVCNGFGVLTAARLAKIIGVDELTIKGFWNGRRRTRQKTLDKILQKTCQLIEPKRAKQLPMFPSATGQRVPASAAQQPQLESQKPKLQEILPPQFLPEPANR
jgi:hypothetical protein